MNDINALLNLDKIEEVKYNLFNSYIYAQHANRQWNMDSVIIWNGVFFGYYLEGFHFSFPCPTLVPTLRELPLYLLLYPQSKVQVQLPSWLASSLQTRQLSTSPQAN